MGSLTGSAREIPIGNIKLLVDTPPGYEELPPLIRSNPKLKQQLPNLFYLGTGRAELLRALRSEEIEGFSKGDGRLKSFAALDMSDDSESRVTYNKDFDNLKAAMRTNPEIFFYLPPKESLRNLEFIGETNSSFLISYVSTPVESDSPGSRQQSSSSQEAPETEDSLPQMPAGSRMHFKAILLLNNVMVYSHLESPYPSNILEMNSLRTLNNRWLNGMTENNPSVLNEAPTATDILKDDSIPWYKKIFNPTQIVALGIALFGCAIGIFTLLRK